MGSIDLSVNDATFSVPLPGNGATWKDSALGPVSKWPNPLHSLTTTIAAFTYPAAIFWGDQLILLYNEAWSKASGINGQGQTQAGKLSADVWEALRSSMKGGKPNKVHGRQLLNTEIPSPHTVLLSPLFSADGNEASGVLAQLIPEGQDSACNHQRDTETASRSHVTKPTCSVPPASKMVDGTDNVPLDEHPFFHRFAEMLPTGLAILDHQANAIFVNQHFYELTTHHDEDKSFLSWPQSIHPDDYDRVMTAYREAFRSQTELRTEFRSLGENYPWRLLLLTPLGDENLQHVSLREQGGFLCSIVDISSEKSAELAERKAAQEAQERKEQQERFIDMISHEIRNPLSAILHCTEDIDVAIQAKPGKTDIESIRQAIETIDLCISHQRNIVDDVLSFSKLDSSMLSLVPKPCEPRKQIANSLKMFQPEFRKQRVEFSYCIDESYDDCAVSWTMADLPRIGQILVNLVTNAIKFTVRKDGEKKVTVTVGASRERPTSYPPSVVFFNADDLAYRMDATNTSEWGNGETLYIMVAVKDSGIGISKTGQKQLFERFRQATPKTGEDYGGSGLGLNISRKLCHLHGGEIGVASEEGSGSTFAFFFKTRRTEPAQDTFESNRQETKDAEKVKDQIEMQGLASPEASDRSLDPLSLDNPSEAKVKGPGSSNDAAARKYEETASVASQVQEPDADPYANSERPKISKAHESGESWQSKDVANGSVESREKVNAQRRTHALLAEDNVVNQRIVFRKLEKQGYNVTTANNGQEATDAVRSAPKRSTGDKAAFDIVLMDQEMPVMDGNAATKEIRKLEQNGEIEHISILGVTANVRDDQQNDMVNSGMDDVISKPYKIEELVTRMERLMDSKSNIPSDHVSG